MGGGGVGDGRGCAVRSGLRLPLRQTVDTNSLNPQDRPRQSLHGYSLAPHIPLLMPFSGSTGPVVHLHGLTGSRKAACESRLGYLCVYQYAWCAWTVQECTFNVRLQLGFRLLQIEFRLLCQYTAP